jgi:Amt family ammonium transporter
VDDPVGAISVHGVCGVFGVLCVGLFADNTYGAGWNATLDGETARPLLGLIPSLFDSTPGIATGQLWAQLIGILTLVVWAFGLSFVFFKVQDRIMGLRVPPEDELIGLDIPETGLLAYPAFRAEPDLIGYGGEPRVSVSAPSGAPKPQSAGREIKTGDLRA